MPPKNSDDQGDNPDKLNFSKTQLTVIVGSIAAIVVLALALGFLTKKNEAKLEEQTKVEAPPAEQATEMPLPDGAKKEELSKLEGTLPKQVPQTPDEELKQKAEKKAEAVPQKSAAAPVPAPPAAAAPQKDAATPAAPAPSTGAIIEKTAPKPAVKIEEKTEPKEVKKAKHEKAKKKRVYPRQRKTLEPLQKQVNVKKINAAPKAEPRKAAKVTGEAPVSGAVTGKLENKPGASSFSTEIKPDTMPPAPATVEAPAPPIPAPPIPAAPKPAEPKAAEPAVAEPKFALLVETVASEADAKNRVAAIMKKGHQAYYLKKETTKNTWYRVMMGAFATKEEADAAAAEFSQKERTTAKVLPYEKP